MYREWAMSINGAHILSKRFHSYILSSTFYQSIFLRTTNIVIQLEKMTFQCWTFSKFDFACPSWIQSLLSPSFKEWDFNFPGIFRLYFWVEWNFSSFCFTCRIVNSGDRFSKFISVCYWFRPWLVKSNCFDVFKNIIVQWATTSFESKIL